MRANGLALSAVTGLLITQTFAAALDVDITDADIRRAIAVAISPDGERERFHARYMVPVQDATVEAMEVITEFRRFVLACEEQLALGNWMVARGGFDAKGQTLKQILDASKGRVTVKARLRFHPHHSYATVPSVEILIGDPSYLPIDTVSTPLLVSSEVGVSAGLTGAVIETSFNAPSIENRTVPVRIVFEGKDLVRQAVDFSLLD